MLLLEIALVFALTLYYYTKERRALHMLQQNLYNENNRYVKWVIKNKRIAFGYFDIFLIVLLLATVLVQEVPVYRNIFMILMIVFAITELYYLMNALKNEKTKKPLVTTARIKRLWITLFILFLAPAILIFVNEELRFIMFAIMMIEIVLAFPMAFLANVINKPVEKCVYMHFAHQAKKKLAGMSQLKIVGITGSYGKTSSKNILNDILSIKYITKPSPKNFNTYPGLMVTVNNYLDKFDEVFIAEMGAYARGDIKQLCDLVHPKYGILTTIGTAHLESFGSEENIQKGKFELIESLPEDGVAVLNGDDPKQTSYEIQNPCKKIWIGIKNHDVDYYATDIKCNSKGTKFTLHVKGDKETYEFETKLLGEYSVYNILAGIALGREFGIKFKDLQTSVHRVKPVEHRLEIKKLGNMYQIDDAYNSNPVGAKMATEVLGMMPGTKVVVTPGMIELGEKEEEYNRIFGRQIAKVADYVVLVGEKRTRPIYKGLLDAGYEKDNIFIINDVRDAYPLISNKLKGQDDIYALFENDLPDTYNE